MRQIIIKIEINMNQHLIFVKNALLKARKKQINNSIRISPLYLWGNQVRIATIIEFIQN